MTDRQPALPDSNSGRREGALLAAAQLTYRGLVLLVVLAIALVLVSAVVVPLYLVPVVALAVCILFALMWSFRPSRWIARLVHLPVDRIRWVGCHFSVTPSGLIVATRRRTDCLPWSGITGVALHPIEPLQATLLGVPPIDRPMIVGRGASKAAWSPLRIVGNFGKATDAPPTQIAMDPAVFDDLTDESAIGRAIWQFRPDVAEALRLPVPEAGHPARARKSRSSTHEAPSTGIRPMPPATRSNQPSTYPRSEKSRSADHLTADK